MKYNLNQKRFTLNGILWSIYDNLTIFFLTAFVLVLGATNEQIGLIAAIPYIAAVMTEIPGAKLMQYFSRKNITFVSFLTSRALWSLIAIAPLILQQSPTNFIIISYFIIKLTELISDPSRISLMADIVPAKIRGRYFGFRQTLINTFGPLAALIAGFYLDIYPKENLTGFLSMFAVGTLFGIASAIPIKKIKEPEQINNHYHLKDFFTLKGEIRTLCYSMVFFNFSIMIASPFFTVYLLKNLEMNYIFFVITTSIAMVTKIISQQHIGKVCDKYGDKPVAIISTLMTSLIPLIYFFITPENTWLLIPAQIISGLAWAGVDLSIFNLVLDKTDLQRRSLDIAEYNTLTSIPMIIAPIIGGYLADNVNLIFTGIPLVFLIAFILRLTSSLTLFHIKETRIKKYYPIDQVFKHMIVLHPFKEIEHTFRAFRQNK